MSNTGDTVPPEFIPDGCISLTDYTAEDLDALAEKIASATGAPTDEILAMLDALVNEYDVPVPVAERSAREQARGGEVSP
jgi:predicted transcriptional regulator